MSLRKSAIAFTGVAALSAFAFAPMLSSSSAGIDGKASAVAAGTLDVTSVQRDAALASAENLSMVPCAAGVAGPFFCNNVDLVDTVPTAAFGGGHGSDSWGWTDIDGTEYVIVTSGQGAGFFRLTDDGTTEYLGSLERSITQATGILWNDVKVVNDHAYITAEDSGFGVQIVDMKKIAELEARAFDGQQDLEQDGFLAGVQGHNMVAFPERDLVGVVLGEEEECGGHLVWYDVSETPLTPEKIGCVGPDAVDQNGKAALGAMDTPHDAQCVIYHGPDADYNGAGDDGELGTADDVAPSDICALFNQYTGGVILMDSSAVTRDRTGDRATWINRFDYENRNYAHQGWFTENHRWVMFNDELDEAGAAATGLGGNGNNQNTNTTTYWIDLTDLDVSSPGLAAAKGYNASHVKKWSNPSTIAIDHNMYIVGNKLYQANYGAGLRVLEFSDESLAGDDTTAAFEEVAYFDTYPGPGPSEFYGAWNVYPFFESGNIILSDFQSGLLVLDVTLED